MNFLILTQYFPPEVGASQTRLFEIAKELKKQGHSVTVVTAMPNYPKGEIFPEYKGKFFLEETICGIEVVRTWIYPAIGSSIGKRLMNYLSFTFTSFLGLMKTSKPDYIFIESPPLFLGIPVYIASRIRGVPFIFNVSDLWLDSVKELGIMNNRALLSFAEKLELFLYKKARYVNGVTKGIVKSLIEKNHLLPHKVLFLPNGVNTKLFSRNSKDWNLAKALRLENKKVFVYAGTIGFIHGAKVILQAAELLRNVYDISFLILGDGSEKIDFVNYASRKNISNVIFMEPVSIERLPYFFSISMASLVTVKRISLASGVRPAKAFPAMASGLPIIYSGEGEGASLIREGKCGLVTEPENPRALAEAVIKIADNPELAKELGENGRKLVEEKFSWDKIVGDWLEELES